MNINDISMVRGDSVTLSLTLTDSVGAPYDLTAADITFTVDDLITKTVGAGITVADPLTGVAAIALDPADTEDCPDIRAAYRYDVQITLSSGSVKTPIRGLFVVLPDVTN